MSVEYSEDRLVQQTTAEFMEQELGWESVYAYNTEVLGEQGTLGRKHEGEVVLMRYLRPKLEELNPGHPDAAYQQAMDQLTATSASKNLLHANREMYARIRDGVRVEYKAADGTKRSPRLRVIDFDEPENNHFLVVRELWVLGMPYRRRPDVLGFVNGLPLLFIELKAHYKSVKAAYEGNLYDYLDTIPQLFHHNAVCMLSNGVEARVGTMVSTFDYFHQWKLIEEDEPGVVEWQTMLRALCDKRRFLDLVENFILFDGSPSGGTVKAMAANHQLMGVNRAFISVQDREVRRGRPGVFWHTQGSGKSYSMVFLSRKIHRKLHGSFTFVILSDRVELDEQIAKTFAGCGAVAKAKAVHAKDGNHLKQLLQEDHRYIFTLIHKFNKDDDEPYTDRKDIIVIADEAHRTQYGKLAENMRLCRLEGKTRPAPGLFVALVVGESMNRRIPNGAWCVWRLNPTGTKQGRVVLAQHRDIQDPEHGGTYTVKVYESEKVETEDGGWRHKRITLKPHSTDPSFAPIVLEIDDLEEGELEIIAELVEVLGRDTARRLLGSCPPQVQGNGEGAG